MFFFYCYRIDANPLLKVVFKTETTEQGGLNQDQIQESPVLWQLRTRMAADSLPQLIAQHMLGNERKTYKILTDFIQQVQFLLFPSCTVVQWL